MLPYPSPSASRYQIVPTPSSTKPSQSLSSRSQTSVPPGWTLACVSSQSVLFATYPAGMVQAWTDCAAFPYPSPSRSLYQVAAVRFVVELLRGVGAPVAKSPWLLFVSVQPLLARIAAVVFERFAVGPAPSKQFAESPNPTKSWIAPPVGQVPVSAVVVLVSATLPVVADIAIAPVALGGGNAGAGPAPAAS